MEANMIADIWSVLSEKIAEKDKQEAAQEYVNTLLDYDIPETTLEGMMGIDTYLDAALEYVLDDDQIIDEEDDWN
tara:strand:- start:1674 stop:1898 length:225 start_codon:yes stop_codon:yes gene_type:complete